MVRVDSQYSSIHAIPHLTCISFPHHTIPSLCASRHAECPDVLRPRSSLGQESPPSPEYGDIVTCCHGVIVPQGRFEYTGLLANSHMKTSPLTLPSTSSFMMTAGLSSGLSTGSPGSLEGTNLVELLVKDKKENLPKISHTGDIESLDRCG